jgi:hypothetical protein
VRLNVIGDGGAGCDAARLAELAKRMMPELQLAAALPECGAVELLPRFLHQPINVRYSTTAPALCAASMP